MNGMVRRIKVVGNWFVSVVLDVCQMFLESCFEGAASFTNVDFGTLSTVDHIDEVVCDTVEVLCHSHL